MGLLEACREEKSWTIWGNVALSRHTSPSALSHHGILLGCVMTVDWFTEFAEEERIRWISDTLLGQKAQKKKI